MHDVSQLHVSHRVPGVGRLQLLVPSVLRAADPVNAPEPRAGRRDAGGDRAIQRQPVAPKDHAHRAMGAEAPPVGRTEPAANDEPAREFPEVAKPARPILVIRRDAQPAAGELVVRHGTVRTDREPTKAWAHDILDRVAAGKVHSRLLIDRALVILGDLP